MTQLGDEIGDASCLLLSVFLRPPVFPEEEWDFWSKPFPLLFFEESCGPFLCFFAALLLPTLHDYEERELCCSILVCYLCQTNSNYL